MEKRNQIKKSIKKLVINKDEVENPHLILRELKMYFMHKYSRKVNVNPESCDLFLDTIATSVLTQNDLQLCEGLVTEGEVYTALTSMKKNKFIKGLSKEFYICFYPELKDHLVNCLNSCYYYGSLSNSQKQAIIRLIEKPVKDIRFVKNWRPISLINVDAKVLSKALVNRIIKVLPKIIHGDQSAFAKGRFIGEPIRLVSDILYYTKENNLQGILFESAFDSLDQTFMLSVLKKFGFGSSFIKWVKVMYTGMESSVLNGGYSTGYFPLERGTRQGDPLAQYLFIVAIEILATLVRNNNNIKGITIHGKQVKLQSFCR